MKKPCQDTDIPTFRSHFENKDPNRNWPNGQNLIKICVNKVLTVPKTSAKFCIDPLSRTWVIECGIYDLVSDVMHNLALGHALMAPGEAEGR